MKITVTKGRASFIGTIRNKTRGTAEITLWLRFDKYSMYVDVQGSTDNIRSLYGTDTTELARLLHTPKGTRPFPQTILWENYTLVQSGDVPGTYKIHKQGLHVLK